MIRLTLRAALVAAPLLVCPLAPAAAQYVVYDPSNYAQNLLQAARALQQVTNQITSLQNEAQMLINQARNLASLPHSSLSALQQSAQRTKQLLGQAQKIAYDVGAIDRAFQGQYGSVSVSSSDAALVTQARSRWETTVAGLQDALRVQAGVVGNLDTGRTQASTLVGQSQAASGALQAMQAGNQLQALQAQQLSDLTAVVAANGRAHALSEAERATAESEGQERYRRFSTPSSYQPSAVTMFRGN
ncbi:P-type conjugative transfer protein TrbJ [Xanthobacter autotrophicus]|uniref:P-type conjugative transfer protein TrbJ n=1 Tax=Xanthobacter autotrophicus TaxID=280 RepID=UPI00372C7169